MNAAVNAKSFVYYHLQRIFVELLLFHQLLILERELWEEQRWWQMPGPGKSLYKEMVS